MVVCVPSNITIASACCASSNGTFVTDTLSNRSTISGAQLQAAFDTKYPGRNNSQYTGSSWITGNLTSTTNVTRNGGGINWCSLPYNPLSNDKPLDQYAKVGFRSGGGDFGQTPQSLIAWMSCFNASVPQSERNAGNAAYICTVDDVRTGGTIEGYTRFQAISAGEKTRAKGLGLAGKGLILGTLGYMAIILL